MSTLKTTNLQNASAASPAIVLAADGSATAQVSSLNGGPLAGARNRIINGDMRISQRGTLTAAPLIGYTLDRWLFSRSGTGSSTVSQSTNASFGGKFALTASSALGAGEIFGIEQRIEASNCINLANQTVTVSFWANASTTAGSLGAFVVRLAYAGSDDNWASDTQIASTVFVPTGTAQKFTLQFSVPGAATTGLKLQFSGAQSGATGTLTFSLGSVQLEPGTVATPFEQRSYGQELALCQRYYEKSFDTDVVPNIMNTAGRNGNVIGATYGDGSGYHGFAVQMKVTKRATPTINTYSNTNIGAVQVYAGSYSGSASASGSQIGHNIFSVTSNSYATNAMAASFFQWTASSEL